MCTPRDKSRLVHPKVCSTEWEVDLVEPEEIINHTARALLPPTGRKNSAVKHSGALRDRDPGSHLSKTTFK